MLKVIVNQSGLSMFKKAFLILFVMLFSISGMTEETENTKFFIVHFEVGDNWDKSLPPQQQPKFREHSQNLNRLRKEKVIVFGARYTDLGVIIVKADSLTKAEAMISVDPGVQSGIFIYKIEKLNIFYPWEP
ncbi:YciI family protein [uncultured Paraglaciecola sp.]|uniref:YciI family protein n=1 Tax=uncultured Paraglaciecola sp. TaxID=1765024 RepID=UPI00262932F3|nr:YciI family protein [uncultured Paraglaciecola sp.]